MPKPPYDWDAEKAAANVEKHGVAFDAVYEFDWSTAIERVDSRYDYGEVRRQVLGRIGHRDHIMVYTLRGNRIRVISFRKANKREQR